MWLAGRDQEAELHEDSAVSLYRAARRADHGYLPAHIRYAEIMIERFELAPLRREYAADSGPVARCIAVAATYSAGGDVDAEIAAFRDVAAETMCSAYFIAFRWPRTSPAVALSEAQRVVAGLPEVGGAWSTYASALSRSGRSDDARRALEQGLGQVPHALDRIQLQMMRAALLTQRGDTARAAALRRAAYAAVLRDGRPGLAVQYLLALPLPPPGSTELERARIGQTAGSWITEWEAVHELGHDALDTGDPAKALRHQMRLVAIADSVGLAGLQLVAYTARGRSYSKLGRLREAERDLRRAVQVGADAALPYYLAEAYHNLAHTFEGGGQFAEASRAADRFVALAEVTKDPSHWVVSLHDAGVIRGKAGWHAAANDAFARMVHVVDELNVEHYWAGEYLERRGDLRGALAYYRSGVAQREDDENLKGEVRVYEALGILDSAELAARLHDSRIVRWTPLEVPLVPEILARRGYVDAAVSEARGWATRQAAGGNVQGAALAHIQVASLLLGGRRAEAAIPEAAVAESLAASLNLTDELIEAHRLKGLALTRAGSPAAGLDVLLRAAALAQRHPASGAVFTTQATLGDALAATRPMDALASYDRAGLEVERLTERLGDDLDRVGYRDRHLSPFDGAIRLLLGRATRGEPLDALLRWSARRKGAALALATQMASLDAAAFARITVRQVQGRLAAGEALIDYLVVDSSVAALVITPRRAVLVPLAIRADTLARLIARLRRPLVATYAGRVDLSRAHYDVRLAASLYAELLAPLRAALGNADHLFIAPDGPLHDVSFDALVSGGDPPRYAIDDYTIEYVPSVQVLAMPSRPASAALPQVLVVERDVPGGVDEVEAIRGAWKRGHVVTLTGNAATETAVTVALSGSPIIHLAVHATADGRDPMASHLALGADASADGLLHMNEIAAAHLHARLVVLSACETQSGRIYGGEGVMGLARAFLLGGTESVVATEWPVGASAADVMGHFYAALAAGRSPASALRDAKLVLRRNPATAHPFYWAAFVSIRGAPIR